MKTYVLIIIALLVNSVPSTAQRIKSGNYHYSTSNYSIIHGLSFHGHNMFRYYYYLYKQPIQSGCFHYDYEPIYTEGIGKYSITDNHLKLEFEPYTYKAKEYTITSHSQEVDSLIIQLQVRDNFYNSEAPGAYIEMKKADHVIDDNYTFFDGIGRLSVPRNTKFDAIQISMPNYKACIIPSDSIDKQNNVFNINVRLKPEQQFEYIEQGTVLLQINSKDKNRLVLTPLNNTTGINFESQTNFVRSNYKFELLCRCLQWELLSTHDLKKYSDKSYDTSPIFIPTPQVLDTFLHNNFIYNRYFDKRGLTIIHYLLEVDGTIKKIAIEKSMDEEFTLEAIRLVSLLSRKWKPATKNGKKVASLMKIKVVGDPNRKTKFEIFN